MDFVPQMDMLLGFKDRVGLLEQAHQQILDFDNDLEDERLVLSDRDTGLLRLYAEDESPEVRAMAVDILAEYGPVTWDDAERWMLDDDAEVRRKACFAISLSYQALGSLCETNLSRCAALFEETAKAFEDVDTACSSMCYNNPEWVDLMWSMLGRLLDIGRLRLNSQIICGLLEDILTHGWITVDDSRLQSWLKGNSVERKMALLSVVQWFGMKEPWQRQITEALAGDRITVVAGTASTFLAGKGVPDIQDRAWAADCPDSGDR